MRIIIVSFCLCVLTFKIFGQSFHKTMFDSLASEVQICVSRDGRQEALVWTESAHMESLVTMYEATNDIKYLLQLVQCIGNVIDRRDDFRVSLGLLPNADHRGEINPTWSTNYYNATPSTGPAYSHAVHSANITYSMAKFAAIVRRTPNIAHTTVTEKGRYQEMRFSEIADDLVEKTIGVLYSHEDQWRFDADASGYYYERCGQNVPITDACKPLPLNKQAFIGRTFVQLYLATHDSAYIERIYRLASYIDKNTSVDEKNNSKKWTYRGGRENELRDDVSHAAYTARFPLECYQNSLEYRGNRLYDYEDMVQYANSFSKGIYRRPLAFYSGVSYPHQLWDFKTNEKHGNAAGASYDCVGWLPFSIFDKSIYQIVLDNYTSKYYNGIVSSKQRPLALALLAKYEGCVIPSMADHGWKQHTKWHGAASGNFDHDEGYEIAASRADNGSLYLIKALNGSLVYLDSLQFHQNPVWAGIASTRSKSNETSTIATISNHSDTRLNGIYLFDIVEGKMSLSHSITNWSTNIRWLGIVAGDFLVGGQDEFIAVRGNRFLIVSSSQEVNEISNQLAITRDVDIHAINRGNFDEDPYDEIAILIKESDGSTELLLHDFTPSGIKMPSLTYVSSSEASWDALATGDFDLNGMDDIMLITSSGKLQLYQVGPSELIFWRSEVFPIEQIKYAVITAGNFIPTTKESEIAIFRNTDGGIVMYQLANLEERSRKKMTSNRLPTAKPKLAEPKQLPQKFDTSSFYTLYTYPNPSHGVVTIVTHPYHEPSLFFVSDLHGNQIASGSLTGNQHPVDLSNEKEGLYFLKVLSSEGAWIRKFILTK